MSEIFQFSSKYCLQKNKIKEIIKLKRKRLAAIECARAKKKSGRASHVRVPLVAGEPVMKNREIREENPGMRLKNRRFFGASEISGRVFGSLFPSPGGFGSPKHRSSGYR